MKVLCTDLKRNYQLYQAEYEEAVLQVLRSGWYILGQELEAFENKFASYLGIRYCIGLNSGLDALTLAVRALNIGPGDEVIVPANTYIASMLSITENGATPIFVEPDIYYNLDVTLIEKAITSHTKAIMPVHLFGQACNMDVIVSIARRYGLYIIEDCAQAHGASFNKKLVGTFSTIGCFSFYPTKPLGALGDAGCVVTNDGALADKLRMLRNYGSIKKYVNDITGVNSRLDEVQAAVLCVGLKHLDEGNQMRKAIAEKYLSDINNSVIQLPHTRLGAENVYHQFPVLCEMREKLKVYLESQDIQSIIHYPIPPHLSPCYQSLGYRRGDFPITERYADQELSLPIYTGMSMEEVDYVIKKVNHFYE